MEGNQSIKYLNTNSGSQLVSGNTNVNETKQAEWISNENAMKKFLVWMQAGLCLCCFSSNIVSS